MRASCARKRRSRRAECLPGFLYACPRVVRARGKVSRSYQGKIFACVMRVRARCARKTIFRNGRKNEKFSARASCARAAQIGFSITDVERLAIPSIFPVWFNVKWIPYVFLNSFNVIVFLSLICVCGLVIGKVYTIVLCMYIDKVHNIIVYN